jgi:hypothetical protein
MAKKDDLKLSAAVSLVSESRRSPDVEPFQRTRATLVGQIQTQACTYRGKRNWNRLNALYRFRW